MKIIKSLIMGMLLSMIFVLNIEAASDTQQESFINRFYTNILERSSDQSGLDYWKTQLADTSAAYVAKGFFNSPEFVNRGLSNEEYVDILFNTLFDRAADAGGRNYWLDKITNGMSREDVLFGFFDSQEFLDLANSFGVTAIRPEDRPSTTEDGTPLEQFVSRFYTIVLNRTAEEGGKNYWVGELEAKRLKANDLANAFLKSEEFIQRHLDNDSLLNVLYKTFMGRDADTGGKNYWLGLLTNGMTNDELLNSFIYSDEFSGIASSYGIEIGSLDTGGGTPTPTLNDLIVQNNSIINNGQGDIIISNILVQYNATITVEGQTITFTSSVNYLTDSMTLDIVGYGSFPQTNLGLSSILPLTIASTERIDLPETVDVSSYFTGYNISGTGNATFTYVTNVGDFVTSTRIIY